MLRMDAADPKDPTRPRTCVLGEFLEPGVAGLRTPGRSRRGSGSGRDGTVQTNISEYQRATARGENCQSQSSRHDHSQRQNSAVWPGVISGVALVDAQMFSLESCGIQCQTKQTVVACRALRPSCLAPSPLLLDTVLSGLTGN